MHSLLTSSQTRLAALCGALLVAGCSSPAPAANGLGQNASGSATQPSAERSAANNKQLERTLEQANEALDKGDVAAALRSIEAGLAAAAAQKDDLFTARLLLLRGNAEQASGRELEARRYYADATAQFHVLKNDEGRLATLISLAGLEMHKGDNAAAEAHLAEAAPFTTELKDRALLARYKEQLGRLLARRLDHSQASTTLAEALRLYKDLNDQRRSAGVLMLMAAADDAAGKDGSSQKSLEAAAKLFHELGDARGEAQAISRLATAAERDGRYSQARGLLSKVAQIHTAAGDPGAAAAVVRHLNALPDPTAD